MGMRKLKRQILRNNGILDFKKVIARQLGCSTKELNRKMKQQEKIFKEDFKDGEE